MATAQRMFFERGVAGVTLESVAAETGVSKMTVYGHFADKATLFEAVIAAKMADMETALSNLGRTQGPVEDALTSFGGGLLRFLLGSDMISVGRVLMVSLAAEPDLARRFYEAGPGRVRRGLAALVAERASRGELSVGDAETAADDLIGLWLGTMPMQMELGLVARVADADLDRMARHGVEVFMRAYAPAAVSRA